MFKADVKAWAWMIANYNKFMRKYIDKINGISLCNQLSFADSDFWFIADPSTSVVRSKMK